MKLCTVLLTISTVLAPLAVAAEKPATPADAKRAAVEVYGKLPLSFEPTASSARFIARSGGYTVSVGARESSVVVTDPKSGKSQTLQFSFANANSSAPLQAMEPQPGVTNYYVGQDSSKWQLGVKNYAKVRAQGVYPGVDVIYYGDHRRLEFDFLVAPKVDPSVIALSFSGMEKLAKDASGDLVAELGGQPIRFAKPYAYQKVSGVSKPVTVDYELASAGSVRLRVGDYDRSSELIIDPVVSYATYLGGGAGDLGNGIAVSTDPTNGGVYITGQTCSPNFPNSPNPSGYTFNTACDAYVTKYKLDGTAYIYTTILGGTTPANAAATGYGVAVDSSNYVYVVGTTNIENLPGNTGGVSNVYQGGDSDAFIVILDNSGKMVRSSYLGGSSADAGYSIAIDQAVPPNVIVVGQTCSGDFPNYNAFETPIEACVAFVTKLDNNLDIASKRILSGPGSIDPLASALTPAPASIPSGPTYYFSETFAGQPVTPSPVSGAWQQNFTYPAGAIVLDTNNPANVQLTELGGKTGTYALNTSPAWNPALLGTTPDGTVIWKNIGLPTTLPPAAFTEAYGVAVDPPGDVFLVGGTNSKFLESANHIDWCNPPVDGSGAWILKVSGKSGACIYSWALETTSTDWSSKVDTARAVAVDSEGKAYVTGTVTGTLMSAGKPYQAAAAGGTDAFLVRVNILGSAIDYATYLGGTADDQGLGVAVDGSFSPYVTGSTQSTSFPTINSLTNPNTGVDLGPSGTQSAFVTKFTADGAGLVFSSYMGGTQSDQGNAISVVPDLSDPNNPVNNMYVAGTSISPDLETSLLLYDQTSKTFTSYIPPQPAYGGGASDAFVIKVPGSLPTTIVAPGSLSFVDQSVGIASAAQPVQFTIQGQSDVRIGDIAFDNSNFKQVPSNGQSWTPADCQSGEDIGLSSLSNPYSGCTIAVTYTPSASSPTLEFGKLSIQDNTSSTAHVVNLSGSSVLPIASYISSSLNFGNQAVGIESPLALTVKVSNPGTATVMVTKISLSGTNPSDFEENDTCAAPLTSNQSCIITMTFTPSAIGSRSVTLTVEDNTLTSDNKPGSHLFPFVGQGVPVTSTICGPNAQCPLLLLSFPAQATNVLSAAQTVTVTNTDPSQTLVVDPPVVSGAFQVSNNTCTAPMTPATSCTFNVQFNPTNPGVQTGTLTISGNGKSTATWPAVVNLSGTAGATATLTAVSSTLTANIGESGTQQWTLGNQSQYPLNIYGIKVSGAAATLFKETDNCGTILVGTSSPSNPTTCTITISFNPTAAGTFNTGLAISTDAAKFTVSNSSGSTTLPASVIGVATAPVVTLLVGGTSANNYTFPSQKLNTASSPVTVTLTNSGTGPLNIQSITIAGAAAGDFSQTNTCGTQVTPNTSCAINVIFTPTALYNRSASLVITGDMSPSSQSIDLLGAGASGAGIQLSPTTVSFGNEQVNTSGNQTVKVTNSSSSTVTISSAISGTNAQDFVISNGSTCTATLAAAAQCSIVVTFTPTTATAEAAVLTVSGVTANLTGTGTTTQTAPSGAADFTLTPDSTGISVTQGGTAQFNFSVSPQNSFKDPITFTCSGPSGSSCSVTPGTLTMDGTTSPSVKLYVNTTGGNGVSAKVVAPRFGARSIFFAVLPFSMMGMLLVGKRRSFWLVIVLTAICLVMGLAGCGSGGSGSTSGGTTSSTAALAAGSYQVVLTASSKGTTPVSHSVTLNLTVTKP